MDLKQRADNGDAKAQSDLGVVYALSNPPDYKEAIKWWSLAAEQGDLSALNNLGALFMAGVGVAQNYAEAVALFRVAAERGLAPAQTNLGKCHVDGHGAPQDHVEAYFWGSLAARQGEKIDWLPAEAKRLSFGQKALADKRLADWKPVTK